MKLNKIIVLLLLMIAVTVKNARAQREIDSLEVLIQDTELSDVERIDALNSLCRGLIYISSEKSLDYGTRALSQAISNGYVRGQANAYRNLASLYSSLGDFVLCASYVKKALSIFEMDRDSAGIANCYITLGHIHRQQKSRLQEIYYHKKAYEVFSRLNIPERIGVSAHNTGESYLNNEDYSNARVYTLIAIRANIATKNLPVLSNCYKVLGKVDYNTNNFEEAEQNLNKVLEISRQLGNNSQKMALAEAMLYLSYIYKGKGQKENQLMMLQDVIMLSRKNKLMDITQAAYYEIISYYLKAGNTLKVDEYLGEYNKATKQISEHQERQTEQLTQAMMSGIDSENERERLDQEKQLQTKLLKARNVQLAITATALFFLGILVLAIIIINRRLKVSLTYLEEQAIFRNKIYSVLLHDLKSPIRFILSNLRGLYYTFEKEHSKSTPIVYDLLQSTSNAYRFMDEFHGWIVRSENITLERELINLQDLLDELIEFYAPLAAHKGITIQSPDNEEIIVRVKVQSLKIVLRNLIDNALKNTSKGHVTLTIHPEINYLNICVEDTGTGMSEEILSGLLATINGVTMKNIVPKFSGGLGFNIIGEFLRSENSLICMDSTLGVGTKIILSLPKG